jgi:hypothetical protein
MLNRELSAWDYSTTSIFGQTNSLFLTINTCGMKQAKLRLTFLNPLTLLGASILSFLAISEFCLLFIDAWMAHLVLRSDALGHRSQGQRSREMNKRPVRLTTTGANAVVATAMVFEILSRWSVFRGGLRRRRLRGSPSKRGRRGLHGLWLRGPTGLSGRRGPRPRA